jgi:hypothetical protein
MSGSSTTSSLRSQIRSLSALGLTKSQRRTFFEKKATVYEFAISRHSAIAVVQLSGNRLRSGIISVSEFGKGFASLVRFRNSSMAVCQALAVTELELFGAAIINRRLRAMLLRQGFVETVDQVPEELGGGEMEILSKTISI